MSKLITINTFSKSKGVDNIEKKYTFELYNLYC